MRATRSQTMEHLAMAESVPQGDLQAAICQDQSSREPGMSTKGLADNEFGKCLCIGISARVH